MDDLFRKKVDVPGLLKKGATIIDVRSPQEFRSGHTRGAINIPMDRLRGEVLRLKQAGKPVILCCASGMRSSSATTLLLYEGIDAHDGGPWTAVSKHV